MASTCVCGCLEICHIQIRSIVLFSGWRGWKVGQKMVLLCCVTNIWSLGCNIARNHVQYRASSTTLTSEPGATDHIRSTDGATDHTQSTVDHTTALEKKRARITA